VDISPTELLIALAVALLILGPTKVPKLARSLGEAIHELKRTAQGSEPEPTHADEGEVVADRTS
jgi:TatA/E family protein of Tat protein translocase